MTGCNSHKKKKKPKDEIVYQKTTMKKMKSKTVIKFGANWCGPCLVMAPAFQRFKDNYSNENIEIKDVDVDEDYKLAAEYKVRNIPYTIFIKDGTVVDKIVGIANYDKLEQTFEKCFS